MPRPVRGFCHAALSSAQDGIVARKCVATRYRVSTTRTARVLTGDYPNGGVVMEDRADGVGVRGLASAVFACGVHPPVTGSLTPGYALCCPVRATGASRTEQPEA